MLTATALAMGPSESGVLRGGGRADARDKQQHAEPHIAVAAQCLAMYSACEGIAFTHLAMTCSMWPT